MSTDEVKIVDYLPENKIFFRQLNYVWIKKYFTIEEEDLKLLENPEEYIIKPGGAILMAKRGEDIIGTCGLLKINDDIIELVKMAVDEKERGKNIGYMLGYAAINKAKILGAKRIQLETSSTLMPAVNLYKKLGFIEVPLKESEYKRCNLKMSLDLQHFSYSSAKYEPS
jgi:GNAT superfamily N-acetyltransferase